VLGGEQGAVEVEDDEPDRRVHHSVRDRFTNGNNRGWLESEIERGRSAHEREREKPSEWFFLFSPSFSFSLLSNFSQLELPFV